MILEFWKYAKKRCFIFFCRIKNKNTLKNICRVYRKNLQNLQKKCEYVIKVNLNLSYIEHIFLYWEELEYFIL